MENADRINNNNFHQLRFVFKHPDFDNVEVFATIPKEVVRPTIDAVVIHSAGIEGDLHADTGDIHESDLALMRAEALTFFKKFMLEGTD